MGIIEFTDIDILILTLTVACAILVGIYSYRRLK